MAGKWINPDIFSKAGKYLGRENSERNGFVELEEEDKYALAIVSTSLGLEEVSSYHEINGENVKKMLGDAEDKNLVHRIGSRYTITEKGLDAIKGSVSMSGSVSYDSSYWDSLRDQIAMREELNLSYIEDLLEEKDQILLSQISKDLEISEDNIESEIVNITESGSFSLVNSAGVTYIERE